jgi:hypothetical protein
MSLSYETVVAAYATREDETQHKRILRLKAFRDSLTPEECTQLQQHLAKRKSEIQLASHKERKMRKASKASEAYTDLEDNNTAIVQAWLDERDCYISSTSWQAVRNLTGLIAQLKGCIGGNVVAHTANGYVLRFRCYRRQYSNVTLSE